MKDYKISANWILGLDKQAVEDFKKQLVSQTIIWDQFKKLLDKLGRENESFEFDFDKPNINERIIYAEGYKKCLKDVRALIPTHKE